MKTKRINIYKRTALVVQGTEYHIYSMVVYPYLYDKRICNEHFSVPLIVEFNNKGELMRIGSYERFFYAQDSEGDSISISCLSSVLKRYSDKDELFHKRIPIKKLLIDHWGENYLENILNDLYDNNDRKIPHHYCGLTKDLIEYSDYYNNFSVFIGGILLYNELDLDEELLQYYKQIIRSKRINKLKERMKLSS